MDLTQTKKTERRECSSKAFDLAYTLSPSDCGGQKSVPIPLQEATNYAELPSVDRGEKPLVETTGKRSGFDRRCRERGILFQSVGWVGHVG